MKEQIRFTLKSETIEKLKYYHKESNDKNLSETVEKIIACGADTYGKQMHNTK